MDFTAIIREYACRITVGRRAAPTGTILAGMYDSACPTDRERGGLSIGRSPPTITCRHLCLGSSRVCLSGCRRRGDVAASLTDPFVWSGRALQENFVDLSALWAHHPVHRRPGQGRQADAEQMEPGSALRAIYKPDSEALDHFIRRKGGINACTRQSRRVVGGVAKRSRRRSAK
jgi:hypothetical protein